MNRRKVYGTIFGVITYIAFIVAATFAFYTWSSDETEVTINISDSYFYCESGVEVGVNGLSPVLDYRDGAYQTFIVNNIGRSDTTFSISLNIESISDSLKSESFKYKVVVDTTGGSNDCTTSSTCTEVENGASDFADFKVGMNTLVETISLPNDSRYKYYVFLYIDGNMENDNDMQSGVLVASLDVCEIVAFLDYNGGSSTENVEFVKITGDTYGETTPSIPTPTKSATTIKYNTNGGNTISNGSITHTFGGWYKDEGEWTNKIESTTEVNTTLNHTLYAKWTSTSVTLPTPTRTGYTFKGWKDEDGTIYTAGASYTLPYDTSKTNVTLTAQWQANTYTITLDGNGATTAGTSSVTATYDSSTISPSTITVPKQVYTVSGFATADSRNSTGATISSTSNLTSTSTFNGWYIAKTDGSKVISNSATPTFIDSVSGYTNASKQWVRTSNTTLYANWTGEDVTLPEITKTGHICGWTEDPTGTTITYESEDSYTPTANTTMYAVCVANKYTVTYDYATNGGTSATKITASVTYGTAVDLTPTATKSGYTFVGWNTEEDATTKLNSLTMGAEDKTLYAIYSKEVTVTATFDKNGGSANTSSTAKTILYNKDTSIDTTLTFTAPACTTYSGWNCIGYNTSKSATTSSLNVGATVNLAVSDTVAESANTLTISSGYYHIWKKNAITYTATTQKNVSSATGTGTSVTCTIDEVYNGATQATSCSVTLPTNPYTLTGFTFNGWVNGGSATTTSSTSGKAAGETMSISGNVNIIATWKKDAITYTATTQKNVDDAAGTGTSVKCTIDAVYNGATQATSCNITLPANPYTLSGWTFNGWVNGGSSTKTSSTSGKAAGETMSISGNVNIIATWKKTVTVTATFDKNGGSANTSATASTTLYNGTTSLNASLTFTAPACTTRAGYDCLGYNTSSTATTSGWNVGATKSISVLETVAIGSSTITVASGYYHIWQANSYTVTFNVNDGDVWTSSTCTGTGISLDSTTCSKTVIYNSTYGTLPTPTRTGYTFNGWYTAATNGTEIKSTTTVSITANQTLYAQWTINKYTLTLNKGTGISSVTGAGIYDYGTEVTISASVSTEYTFSGWTVNSGNTPVSTTSASTTVTITEDTTLTANATANELNITLNANNCGTINNSNPFTVENGTNTNDATSTTSKKVIVFGDRDVINGPAISAVINGATVNGMFEVVYENTLLNNSVTFDVDEQNKILDFVEKYGREQLMVVLGNEEGNSSWAEVFVTGDPTYAGPLTGVALHLDVWHITELKNEEWIDQDIYADQIEMMEMVLDVDSIAEEMEAARANNDDVLSSGILFTANDNSTFNGWYTSASGGSKVLDRNGLFTGTAVSGYTTTDAWNLTESKTLYAQCSVANAYTVSFDSGNLVGGLEDYLASDEFYVITEISDGVVTVSHDNQYPQDSVTKLPINVYLEAGTNYTFSVTPLVSDSDGGIPLLLEGPDSSYIQLADNPYSFEVTTSGTYYLFILTHPSSIISFKDISIKQDISEKTYTHGTYARQYGSLTTPVKGGYTFDGWYTAETGGTKVTSTTTITNTTDHTLYARWITTNYSIKNSSGTVTGYAATLADAISAASAGNTITLLKDYTDTSTVTFNKNLTFNTNGYTLTRSGTMIVASTLTKVGTGTITCNNAPTLTVNDGGSLVYNNGIITNTSTANTISNQGTGTVTISGGTVTHTLNQFIIWNASTGSVVINGGTVSGHAGVYNAADGVITLKTGTVNITTYTDGTDTDYSDTSIGFDNGASGGTINVNGGNITSDTRAFANMGSGGYMRMTSGTVTCTGSAYCISNSGPNGEIDITGGTITHSGSVNAIYNNTTGTLNITGGTFSSSSSARFIYNNGAGIVNMSGGSLDADGGGIYNRGTGTVNVSGSTEILANGSNGALYNYGAGTINMTGGSIESSVRGFTNYGSGIVNMSGGTIVCTGNVICTVNTSTGTVKIVSGNIVSVGNSIYQAGTGKAFIGFNSTSGKCEEYESNGAVLDASGSGYATIYNGNSTNGSHAYLQINECASVNSVNSNAITNKGGFVEMTSLNDIGYATVVSTESSSTVAIINRMVDESVTTIDDDTTYSSEADTSGSVLNILNADSATGVNGTYYWGRIWIIGGLVSSTASAISSNVPNTFAVIIGANSAPFHNSYGETKYYETPVIESSESYGVYINKDKTGCTSCTFRLHNGIVGGYNTSNVKPTTARSGYSVTSSTSLATGYTYYRLISSS